MTVITEGSRYYSLCSVSSSLSHATLKQPFRTLAIKREVYILLKKSSCVFLHASLSCVRLYPSWVFLCVSVLLLFRCDAVDEYITTMIKMTTVCLKWSHENNIWPPPHTHTRAEDAYVRAYIHIWKNSLRLEVKRTGKRKTKIHRTPLEIYECTCTCPHALTQAHKHT